MCVILVVICTLCQIVLSEDVGDRCITPNGELATCVPIGSCEHILEALLSLDLDVVEFAKDSQCENNNQTLICCGSTTSINTDLEYSISKLIPNRTQCGFGKESDRIYGGQYTELEEYPWMALLGYTNQNTDEISFKCGGTVINNRYILTAAHCIRINPAIGISLHLVRLGEWNISSVEDCYFMEQECADPVIDLLIEKQIPHPNYSARTGLNDIGLLRLKKNVAYSSYIRPICLPFNQGYRLKNNTSLVVSGWGATEMGTSSVIKLKVELPVVPNTDCQAKLVKKGLITPKQICAGGVPGKDACNGDSGGPLMSSSKVKNSPFSQWYQEGIVSWGNKCGISGYPGIYTRVSKYLIWILDNLENF